MASFDFLNDLYYRFRRRPPQPSKVALVLGGGGARSAYQAGVLLYMGEYFPDLRFPLQTGVSAGAINIGHLASTRLDPKPAAEQLARFWSELTDEHVYREESSLGLLWSFLRGASSDNGDGADQATGIRSLLDHTPLRDLLRSRLELEDDQLSGIQQNLDRGLLEAAAIVTTNYSTSQTVTWVQGRDIQLWERPNRVSRNCTITLDHIMASASLPLMFPAVKIEDAWYGDGGIRFVATDDEANGFATLQGILALGGPAFGELTAPAFADVVGRFVVDGQTARLTQASLETLAVIAYRQPVSRGRVAAIRGVNVDGVVRTLQARGLIEEAGQDEDGGAVLYRTTPYFLERMGLTGLGDLPPLAPYLPDLDTLDDLEAELR